MKFGNEGRVIWERGMRNLGTREVSRAGVTLDSNGKGGPHRGPPFHENQMLSNQGLINL